jgi:hypothetical protein
MVAEQRGLSPQMAELCNDGLAEVSETESSGGAQTFSRIPK